MNKPNYKELNLLADDASRLDRSLEKIVNDSNQSAMNVVRAVEIYVKPIVDKQLRQIPIDELGSYKQGIRGLDLLKSRGYRTLYDVKHATQTNLTNINGIGEKTAVKIKTMTDQIASSMAADTKINFDVDTRDTKIEVILKAINKFYERYEQFEKARKIFSKTHTSITSAVNDIKRIAGPLKWFFSNEDTRRTGLRGADFIDRLLNTGTYVADAQKTINEYSQKRVLGSIDVWRDYSKNSINYHFVLDKLNLSGVDNTKLIGTLDEDFAKMIDESTLRLDGLKCNLRHYQEFGVKYIITQSKVLLGDEMGLGKTVQAIAAMVHLRNNGATHFLVICPASVLINWVREIEKHSDLVPYKIHGNCAMDFDQYVKEGGVAVTTYDTLKMIHFDSDFRLAMTVVDEAHYVKNPQAQRTRNTELMRRISDNILYMTGTPLENNVGEMVYLISCLKPEIAKTIENITYLAKSSEFRKRIGTVYLRRTREDVLQELPDLIETEQVLSMNDVERKAYYNSVKDKNFMGMRQVSWQVADPVLSFKAQRCKAICEEAFEDDRKVLIFSYFTNTIAKAKQMLGDSAIGVINGSMSSKSRQELIDKFTESKEPCALLCQVVAGGTGLNIQAASVVILCEPQIKPSLEHQAISRAYRMGQARSVMVYRLLSEDSVDERIMELLATKQELFDNFADESVAALEDTGVTTDEISKIISDETDRLNEYERTHNGESFTDYEIE